MTTPVAPLRLAVLQMNPWVGAVEANGERIQAQLRHAEAVGAHLLLTPELALTGYPPEDLLLRPHFLDRVQAQVEALLPYTRQTGVLLGTPWRRDDGRLVNAALWLQAGRIELCYAKQKLPNYSVFDEQRYFTPGQDPGLIHLAGLRLGVTVCEDIWEPEPAQAAAAAGAQCLLNINASPYHRGKATEREAVVRARAQESGLPVVYLNLVGGQDELVFDGRSFAMQADGRTVTLIPAWVEGCAVVDVHHAALGVDAHASAPSPGADEGERQEAFTRTLTLDVVVNERCGTPSAQTPRLNMRGEDAEAGDLYHALMLGIHDYVHKNGFAGVLLGLSGGIDSALTAALAHDALGADAVTAVMMPYRYTASMSVDDARQIAECLGITYHEIAIEPMVAAFHAGLRDFLPASLDEGVGSGVAITEQNLQSRCRGVLLMALSNQGGRLVLATGNKSEMAVGYATLYGDMAGGLAPLRDVSKQWVYRLARWRNQVQPVIPERVITRPPSAELAPGQEDRHSLPDYPVLDAILEAFIEREASVAEIVADGYPAETVAAVARLVLRAEFKRRQAAPGIRVSRRAFGRDRRYPITSGYQE